MAILALDSIRALRELEASSSRVRQGYLSRERSLRKIRVSIYESGNLLREYALADSSAKTRQSYLEQLHDMRNHSIHLLSFLLHFLRICFFFETEMRHANETL
jgi:hypothetical protein